MNILMALSQTEVTGAEVYATTIGDELTSRGHHIFYVSDTLTKAHKGNYFKLRFNKRSIPRRVLHLVYLIFLIKKFKIQLVHAHSRASSWSCYFACKLTHTPLVSSIHGRQPLHATSKRFQPLGDKGLPVCEAIYSQLINDFNLPKNKLEVSRNGIDTKQYTWLQAPKNEKKIISIIGRLTGPKGVICYRLLNECIDVTKYKVRVISGSQLPSSFNRFKSSVDFLGYSEDIPSILAQSDLVIGAGRVAIESLLCGRPTLAIGEASCIGIITKANLSQAMVCNFGDIGPKNLDIDFSTIPSMIDIALQKPYTDNQISDIIKAHYALSMVTLDIEHIYQSVYSKIKRQEIPVLMYHRFAKTDEDKGNMAPYIDIKRFENHLKLLKFLGFESLTFSDLSDKGCAYRIQTGKRFCIITVDDGYKDNYTLMLPLLKKYDFKAVVYMVSGVDHNKWDVELSENPEKRFDLMSSKEIQLMAASGHIEFGGHTLNHPYLSRLSFAQKQSEINENKTMLEEIIGKPLLSFAYPYGEIDEQSKTLVKQAGYQFAVATNSGPLSMHEDLFEIRRIGIFPGTDTFAFARKITGHYLFRKTKL